MNSHYINSPEIGVGRLNATAHVHRPGEIVGRGDVSGTTALVFFSRAELERKLPRGLAIEPVPGSPPGMHPVWIGLDRVSDGRYAVGPFGSWLNAPPYNRLFVGIPNVKREGGKNLYTFTPRIFVDGYLSWLIDHSLGFGFNKKMVDFSGASDRNFTVRDGNKTLLRSQINRSGPWQLVENVAGTERLQSLTSQPLLGRLSDDLYAVSESALEFDASSARVALAKGEVTFHDVPGVVDGHCQLGDFTDGKIGALVIKGVPHSLRLPTHVKLRQL